MNFSFQVLGLRLLNLCFNWNQEFSDVYAASAASAFIPFMLVSLSLVLVLSWWLCPHNFNSFGWIFTFNFCILLKKSLQLNVFAASSCADAIPLCISCQSECHKQFLLLVLKSTNAACTSFPWHLRWTFLGHSFICSQCLWTTRRNFLLRIYLSIRQMAMKENVDHLLSCTVKILTSSHGSQYCNINLMIFFLNQSFMLCTGCPDRMFLKESFLWLGYGVAQICNCFCCRYLLGLP